jgi:hypothetical protein
LAQHHRQLAHVPHANQLARQIGPIERLREEEPQRRHDGVHGRRRHVQLALLDLEAPNVLRRCGVGRAPQERREPADIADVVALRLVAEAPYPSRR